MKHSGVSNSAFVEFAETCEAIGSTRSKLQKIRILSEYLSQMESDEALKTAVTFLSGRIFPPGENERELNVGYSILWNMISELSGLSDTELSKRYLKHGDLGDVFAGILSGRSGAPLFQTLVENRLDLGDVHSAFQDLSKTTGEKAVERKKQILLRLFSSAKSPLEGKYLVKILAREMRIGLVEGLVEESIAKCYSKTLEEIRMADLLIANPGEVALLAKHNRLSNARLEPLRPTNFMLASSARDGKDLFGKFKLTPFFAEFKYDGIRAQLHKCDANVRIFSRNLADISQFFPEVKEALSNFEERVLILDGEIIAFQDEKPLPFQMLQKRLRKLSRSESDTPIRYFAFDILHHGTSLIGRPFEERLEILRSIKTPEIISFSEQRKVSSVEDVQAMFAESKELGYEGLVAKDPASHYAPGRRGNSWVKLKEELDTLDVVIVAAEYGHGKRAGVISDYTFAVKEGADLKVVGKAYSGLTDAEISEMTTVLKSITLRDSGYGRTVKPQVVIEVAFDAVQRSDRHDSGFALRFPRIKRIRTDKSVSDIDTLEHVRKIYEAQKVKE
ncbi:MAG: ATP-dependent DNA ligase [Nitrososphaerales archaeon]